MPRTCLALAAAAVLLAGCARRSSDPVREFHSVEVTLPNGQVILCEPVSSAEDMLRGMMYRDSIAPDAGMLFLHGQPGRYSYWMYQTRIPLDILWMDRDKRIVEMSLNTPPCKTAASQCPHYGGNEMAQYVLELGGGMAAKYGLKVGDVLRFY